MIAECGQVSDLTWQFWAVTASIVGVVLMVLNLGCWLAVRRG